MVPMGIPTRIRLLTVGIAVLGVLAACGGNAGSGTEPRSVAVPTQRPETPQPDGGGGEGDGFACTRVLGFSQTRQWYWYGGFERFVDEARWELFAHHGAGIRQWADPTSRMWTQSDLDSPCLEGSGSPDRVLLTISDDQYVDDVSIWVTYIRSAVDTIRAMYPSVRQIVLQPVVGGPGGEPCEHGGITVRATFNQPFVRRAIAQVTGGSIVAGASPQVRTCDDYQDSAGHLEGDAREPIGQALGEFYASF